MNQLRSADVLLQEGSDKHDLLLFVETALWHGSLSVQTTKSLKAVSSCINVRLSDPKTRLEGLLLLNTVIANASPEVFAENYQPWIQHVKKLALHEADERLRCLAIKILGEILQIAVQHPEYQRQIAANFASPFILQLLEMNENCDLTVAHGLLTILKFFPGPSRHHMTRIQKRIIDMLSVKSFEIIQVASTCMALLPFTVDGDRGKANLLTWTDIFKKLCHTLHWELNTLYENLEMDQPVSIELNEQILFPFTLENVDAASLLLSSYRRTIAICLCLQKLLGHGSEALVTVPVEKTLELIYRILKINVTSLNLRRTEDCQAVLLHAILPVIHGEALVLLEQLLLSCKKLMLLHDQKILSFIHQTLQWTSASQSDNASKSILRKLRDAACRVLMTWLTIAGSAADLEHLGDSIVHQLLKDAFLEEKSSTETRNGVGDGSPKSKRPKLVDSLLTQNQRLAHVFVDDHTPKLALKALNIILLTASEDLQIATLKDVENKVLSLLMKFHCGCMDHLPCSIYVDSDCRAALYELVLSLVLTPSLNTQVLLSKSLHAFSLGQSDASSEVSQICLRGLAICRSIIDPVRRCLPLVPFSKDMTSSRLSVDASPSMLSTDGFERPYQLRLPASSPSSVEFTDENAHCRLMSGSVFDHTVLRASDTSRIYTDTLELEMSSKITPATSVEDLDETTSFQVNLKIFPKKDVKSFSPPTMTPEKISRRKVFSSSVVELSTEENAEHQVPSGGTSNIQKLQSVTMPLVVEVDLIDSSPERQSEPATVTLVSSSPKSVPEETSPPRIADDTPHEGLPLESPVDKLGSTEQMSVEVHENSHCSDLSDEQSTSDPSKEAVLQSVQSMLDTFVNCQPDDDARD